MNNVFFEYLDDFCIIYLDDILIYSENPIEYRIYIHKVFQKLKKQAYRPISRNISSELLRQNT
jgi:hypothetical protein